MSLIENSDKCRTLGDMNTRTFHLSEDETRALMANYRASDQVVEWLPKLAGVLHRDVSHATLSQLSGQLQQVGDHGAKRPGLFTPRSRLARLSDAHHTYL